MNQTAASVPLGPPPPSAPALERWMWRLRRWWPPFNFLLGIASFFLVNRQVAMGSWIAGFLMLSWLLILFEGTLGRWLSAWRPDWAKASPWMLRFLTQGVHQESFFFALPFLLHTTTWTSPQALFTLVVAGAALASMWDPFYYDRIGHHAGVFLAYHALAVYVTMLVLLPALGHVTTQTTTVIAAIAIALLSVPSLAQLFDRRRWWRWLAMFAGAGALGFAALLAAPFVPPATLWISQGAISTAWMWPSANRAPRSGASTRTGCARKGSMPSARSVRRAACAKASITAGCSTARRSTAFRCTSKAAANRATEPGPARPASPPTRAAAGRCR